ncbi:hypothetical protein DL762_003935 [Monosporascus cannonballus]|uniref:GDP/GTP exchange factor Sec2 N-terminal domain-containing protein n=1 Tax=Monosporascus cannonballus TaxID=155416 RepID=A0ABY0HDP4_9PEZI|nr:hypothetical protein DL762_003935 [Monosporascus cannonballus]
MTMTMSSPPTTVAKTTFPIPTTTNTDISTNTNTTGPSPSPSVAAVTSAAAEAPPPTTPPTATTACCPNCGLALPRPLANPDPNPDPHAALLQAQRQIEDLQAQVRLLNQKAAAAVDRWADYEDELSRLRAASVTTAPPPPTNTSANNSVAASSPRSSSFLPAGAASRLSQLLSPRKSLANLAGSFSSSSPSHNHSGATRPSTAHAHSPPQPQTQPQTPPPRPQQQQRPQRQSQGRPQTPGTEHTAKGPQPQPPQPAPPTRAAASEGDLQAALARERELRRAAEGKLSDTSREVEELSASLFEQANEMVAAERRARAKLEERIDVLERRAVEKRSRLERLEGAVGRLERVRALLES